MAKKGKILTSNAKQLLCTQYVMPFMKLLRRKFRITKLCLTVLFRVLHGLRLSHSFLSFNQLSLFIFFLCTPLQIEEDLLKQECDSAMVSHTGKAAALNPPGFESRARSIFVSHKKKVLLTAVPLMLQFIRVYPFRC